MDDYPGQTPAPVTPPPPTYQPPAPAAEPPVATPAPAYAPPQGYAPPPAPPKKKTWLWIVIGIVVLGLLGCCGAMAIGGFSLFKADDDPAASITAINQAALDGDTAGFEKYFDAESVARTAYTDFIEYVKGTEDYASIVTEMGEEEADRILREEIIPEETFVEELTGEFSVDSLEEGQVPFPEFTVSSTSVENDTAELTIVTVEDGQEVTYVLGMAKESVGDETVWRVKEIKNIADMMDDQL